MEKLHSTKECTLASAPLEDGTNSLVMAMNNRMTTKNLSVLKYDVTVEPKGVNSEATPSQQQLQHVLQSQVSAQNLPVRVVQVPNVRYRMYLTSCSSCNHHECLNHCPGDT
jgi:hypothetical protein